MTSISEPGAEQRKLRISYLFPQFPVRTEAFAVSDIVALRSQGHTVVVHTLKPRRGNEAELLELCEVPPDLPIMRPSIKGVVRWPSLLWRSRRIAAMLVARSLSSATSAPSASLAALLCIPRTLEVLAEAHSCGSDVLHVFWARHMGMALAASRAEGDTTLRSAFVGAYDLVADDFLVDTTLEAADVVFSHAETNRDYAQSKVRSGVPVHIIRRGIPLPPFRSEAQRDCNRWVTASALVPSKNVEAVLRLFAAARGERPELTLSVFGEGPERKRLEKLAADLNCAGFVDFGGHISRTELFTEMQKCGAFLLLSKKPSERLPNVIKEALWAGCAVIASRSEGIEELIPDSGIGLVVDPDQLAAALGQVRPLLEETEGAAAERRARARQHIADNFSSERSMRGYAAAWHQLLQEHIAETQLARPPTQHLPLRESELA